MLLGADPARRRPPRAARRGRGGLGRRARLRRVWNDAAVRISAKADYAVRAAIELAAAGTDRPTKGDAIAQAQGIPLKFLENILADMRHAGLVTSRRGAEGGYWLARPAEEITVADIIRAGE